MAVVWVKTGTFTTPASGTTVIDVTSKGNDAKGVLFWATSNSSNQTNQVHAVQMYGFSDGTTHHCRFAWSEQAANDQRRDGSSAAAIYLGNADSDTINVLGTAAMNANDVTITYSTFEAGWIINYMIFGGSDCEAAVDTHESNASNSPFTGLSFTPDLIFASTHGTGIAANSQHSYISLGAAHDNGASIDQWILATYMGANNVTPKGSILMSGEIVGQIDLAFTNWYATISAVSSSGFSWTNPGGTGGSDDWSTLCIDLSGAGVDVGTFTKPTGGAPATGAFPDLGFTPQGYLVASAGEVNETDGVANDATLSVGAYDGTDQNSAISTAQDNDNTDCHQRANNAEVLELSDDLDTNGVEASGTAQAITDSTPDIEWNPNTSNATIIGYAAIEVGEGGPDETATGAPSIILPTSAGTATVERNATGAPSIILPTASGAAHIWPRVYLNTSQTKAGATEMVVTAASADGTSVTFDDALGAPTGALFLGVERQSDDLIGWIAVTVNSGSDEQASGAPEIILPTSAGTAEIIRTADGASTIILPTSAGTAKLGFAATGAPSIPLLTSSGTAKVIKKATGAAAIALLVAAGVAEVLNTADGAPEIILPTSAGTATVERNATGAPSIILPTSAGTAGIDRNATGSPSIILPTSAGTAEIIKTSSGAPEIILPTSAGEATVSAGGPDETATGAPEIILPTSSGAAEIIKPATGTPSIILPTSAGTAEITRPATGAPSIILPVAAGVAEVLKTAAGSPSIILPTSAGTAGVAFAAKDTSVRVTFGTPAAPPQVGAGLQRFNLNLRRDAAHVGGSGIPTVNVYLYEDGVQRGAALLSDVPITSDTGQLLEALWDASDLVASASGSAVECFVEATAVGAGADRRAVEVGAIEWCTVAGGGGTFANGAPSIILPTSAGTAEISRTATGAPSIILPTSAGTAEVIKTADGAPSIILPTSAGTAEIIKTADGAPSIILPTSAGVADAEVVATTATGAPSIILPTSAGVAEIIKTATGAPSIILPTSAGVAEVIKTASGSPSIILPTSAGTAGIDRTASGAPSLPLITSAGSASAEGVESADGAPSIILPTSAGTAIVGRSASGAPSIILPTSAGAAEIIKTADGAPSIILPTSAGTAEISGTASGAPSIILPTSAGSAEIIKTADGAPSIILPTSAGVADVEGVLSATGAPSIPLLTAAGVATVTGDADQVHPPGTSRKRKKEVRRLLDEDELLFVIITAFLQIKDD